MPRVGNGQELMRPSRLIGQEFEGDEAKQLNILSFVNHNRQPQRPPAKSRIPHSAKFPREPQGPLLPRCQNRRGMC